MAAPAETSLPRLSDRRATADLTGPTANRLGYADHVTTAASPEPRGGARSPGTDASPAEVRAALIPEEAAEFEREWREVMARAAETLDLSEVLETLESWRLIAQLTAAAGPEAHRAMYRRAATRLTGQDIPVNEPVTATKARLGL